MGTSVGRGDLALLVQNGFRRTGDAGFDGWFDLDGDGVIGRSMRCMPAIEWAPSHRPFPVLRRLHASRRWSFSNARTADDRLPVASQFATGCGNGRCGAGIGIDGEHSNHFASGATCEALVPPPGVGIGTTGLLATRSADRRP